MSEQHYAWGAATTLPRAEFTAMRSVAEAGYVTWLPQYKRRKVLKGRRIENGRRIRSRSDSVVFEQCPLFRGYLFVQIPYGDGGYAIDNTVGVARLLRTPSTDESWGRPKIIRARFIIQLQEWADKGLVENERGEVVPEEQGYVVRPDLPLGSTVRTPSGIVGALQGLDERGRAELLAEMLGAPRIIRDVDAETLELVSA